MPSAPTPEEIQHSILEVLAGQSPGYLAHTDASAFAAAGITDPSIVETALAALSAAGHAEEQEDVVTLTDPETGEPMLDEEENPIETVGDSGWVITEAGRTALAGA
jgi:hypothetical protein